jgi:hypothetical protein
MYKFLSWNTVVTLMVDFYRLEAKCAGCGERYRLEVENKGDFAKDSAAGVIEAVIQIGRHVDTQEAANRVEKRMQKHHNLNIGPNGKLYCDDCP